MEIELGRSNPKAETLFLIATELHVSIDAIIFTNSNKPNAVSPDVLSFFALKTDDESKRYVEVCQQIESLHT